MYGEVLGCDEEVGCDEETKKQEKQQENTRVRLLLRSLLSLLVCYLEEIWLPNQNRLCLSLKQGTKKPDKRHRKEWRRFDVALLFSFSPFSLDHVAAQRQ